MCACLPRLIKPDRFLQEYFSDRCNTLGLWTTAAIVGSAYHAMLELPVTDAYAGTSGKVAELVSAAADTLVGFWAAFLGLCLQPLEMLALVGYIQQQMLHSGRFLLLGCVRTLPAPHG